MQIHEDLDLTFCHDHALFCITEALVLIPTLLTLTPLDHQVISCDDLKDRACRLYHLVEPAGRLVRRHVSRSRILCDMQSTFVDIDRR